MLSTARTLGRETSILEVLGELVRVIALNFNFPRLVHRASCAQRGLELFKQQHKVVRVGIEPSDYCHKLPVPLLPSDPHVLLCRSEQPPRLIARAGAGCHWFLALLARDRPFERCSCEESVMGHSLNDNPYLRSKHRKAGCYPERRTRSRRFRQVRADRDQ